MSRDTWRRIVGGLLTGALVAGLTIAITDDGDGGRSVVVRIGIPQVVVPPAAVAVDGPDTDAKRDDALPLDRDAQAQIVRVSQTGSDPGEGDLRGEDATQAGVLVGPLATQEWPGCRTAFVRNFSSRAGATPKVIYWHQTVSRENGWSSQNALTALANNPVAQVSWHFLIGRSNGLCTYSVPTEYKAWTEGNANREGIGIEVEAYGDESTYVTGAGKARLLEVTRRLGKLYGVPMRRGIVRECEVVLSGIVEHKDADQATTCAGGHADVNLPGTDELIAELAKGECDRACELRGKHRRTHRRIRERDCAQHQGPGYCDRLRKRNRAVHIAARREGVSLKGTYR